MKIAIIGTGYVGLVTGACLAKVGNTVTCVDVDKVKIDNLNNGILPIYEPGLSKIIKESSITKNIFFTTDISNVIKNNEYIFIAVGTPIANNGSCNLKYVYEVAESIGKHINDFKFVIMKSTVPVGTANEVKKIILKEILNRKIDISFEIVSNPEFLKQGKAVNDFMSPDRIVAGVESTKSRDALKELYKPFSINHEKLIFMDIASSELTKYASNAMLATKISFINEMSIISEKLGADINEVRKGIGSDPRIGYDFIYPSAGYGGSCFPKDVSAILDFSKKTGYKPRILEAVKNVNDYQKKYFFKKILKKFGESLKGRTIAIWGLSFKPGTDDMRESVSIYIVKSICDLGGFVNVYDPKAMNNAKKNYFSKIKDIKYCEEKYDALKGSDALLLLTEWPEFRSPDFNLIKKNLKQPLIFDAKNQYSKRNMMKNEFVYYQIGVKPLK